MVRSSAIEIFQEPIHHFDQFPSYPSLIEKIFIFISDKFINIHYSEILCYDLILVS